MNIKPHQREGFGPPLTKSDVFDSQDLRVLIVNFKGGFYAIEWTGNVCQSTELSPIAALCTNPDCEMGHPWEM
jgi:hypothetical protein